MSGSAPGRPASLYHFTCADGRRLIDRTSTLRPQGGLWPFIWLTSEREPDFEATGLTRRTLNCDRTEFRYVVTGLSACRPWLGSPERARLDAEFREVLESHGDPEHWWITSEPVPCRLDGPR